MFIGITRIASVALVLAAARATAQENAVQSAADKMKPGVPAETPTPAGVGQ